MSEVDTAICQMRGVWSRVGKLVHKFPMFSYQVPIRPDDDMVERLGAVKLRSDGRWNWWRWASKWHRWKTGQGVEDEQEEARARVLEGWQ